MVIVLMKKKMMMVIMTIIKLSKDNAVNYINLN
jgi:hypothetical protein